MTGAAVLATYREQQDARAAEDGRNARELRERIAHARRGADLEQLSALFSRLPAGSRRSVDSLAHWLHRDRCDECARAERLPNNIRHNGLPAYVARLCWMLARPGGPIEIDHLDGAAIVREPEPARGYVLSTPSEGDDW